MLPFLKHSKDASVSGPVEHVQRKPDEAAESYDLLEAAAEDLHTALKSGNIKDIAQALRAAFEICDSQPHEEGPHE